MLVYKLYIIVLYNCSDAYYLFVYVQVKDIVSSIRLYSLTMQCYAMITVGNESMPTNMVGPIMESTWCIPTINES